jgi:hypothetical protein
LDGSSNTHINDPDTVIITDRYDETLAEFLHKGGRALLLASAEDALPPDWPIRIEARKGTELDGRWFSNFNWIRLQQPPFATVGFTRIVGFESQHVAPEYVIRGIAPEQFDNVLSGITFGWLNNNSGLAIQTNVGRGRLLLTTYRFGQYGVDPYSTALLNAMIAYVGSESFQPAMSVAATPVTADVN